MTEIRRSNSHFLTPLIRNGKYEGVTKHLWSVPVSTFHKTFGRSWQSRIPQLPTLVNMSWFATHLVARFGNRQIWGRLDTRSRWNCNVYVLTGGPKKGRVSWSTFVCQKKDSWSPVSFEATKVSLWSLVWKRTVEGSRDRSKTNNRHPIEGTFGASVGSRYLRRPLYGRSRWRWSLETTSPLDRGK